MRYTDETTTDQLAYDDRSPNREERLKFVPNVLGDITAIVLGYRPKNKAKNLRPKKRKKAK
jgi:hypothetical protein